MTKLSNYSTSEDHHSTMISMSISVKYLYFEYKELTLLHGESTFNTFQKLLSQMKVNTSSVPKNLGKGGHGFIGIILSIASYATLAPLTPFLLPKPPGILTVPAGSTQYETALRKTQHHKALDDYHLYILVQRALIQKGLDSIKSKYLAQLCNRLIG